MVGIIPRTSSFGQEIARGLGAGVSTGFSEAMQAKEDKKKLAEENEAIKKYTKEHLGKEIDLTGITNPETRKTVFLEAIKAEKPLNDLEKAKKEKEQALADKYKQQLKVYQSLTGEEEEKPQEKMNIPGIKKSTEQEEEQPSSKSKKTKEKLKLPHSEKDIAKMTFGNPALASVWQRQNTDAMKQQQHQEKTELETKKYFNEASKKYRENLSDIAGAAEKKNRALDRQMEDVNKINWYDRTVSTLFRGSPFEELLKSNTAQKFDSNILPQLEGQRQILGGILSDADIRLLLQKVVTSSKTPEANKYIAKWMKMENNLLIAKNGIANEIIDKNDGFAPANFTAEVERIYNQRYGEDIQDIYNKITSLPDDNKKLESYRRKVPPGTQITDEMVDMYLKMGGDVKEAKKMASEDGYDLSNIR